MRKRVVSGIILFFILLNPLLANDITYKETRIPMAEAGSDGLEALLVWPNDTSSHPLAIISHGSPRDGKLRKKMSAISFLPIATEFARRGFAVAVVMRRGYASSGGGWAESTGNCAAPSYQQSAAAASKDLHTAIAYLGTLPQFDIKKILAVGVSAGGFSTVALTADHPPAGLVAAISFAGGRGSKSNDSVCSPDILVKTFGEFGKTSHTPMLWVYAENDHFFNPALAERFHTAFTNNGGNAKLITTPAYGSEGHFLFSTAGIPMWTPMVDEFLLSQHLILVDKILPAPETPKLMAPINLSAEGKKDFETYLKAAPHKAFAVSAHGAYGWRTGQRTILDAEKDAINNCQKHTRENCRVIATDDIKIND